MTNPVPDIRSLRRQCSFDPLVQDAKDPHLAQDIEQGNVAYPLRHTTPFGASLCVIGAHLGVWPQVVVLFDTQQYEVQQAQREADFAVEIAVVVLLVKRAGPYDAGAWALPGTFLHEGERLADAVLRSLRDKAGIQGTSPKQLHVFDDPGRDDRGWVISVAHLDVVPWTRLTPTLTGRDDVRLVPVDDATNLPFDHDTIVTVAVTTLRETYTDKPDPHRLLPDEFTLLQLRRLHEAVLVQPLVKDTFRRTMQPHLQTTEKFATGEVGKPARIYRHST